MIVARPCQPSGMTPESQLAMSLRRSHVVSTPRRPGLPRALASALLAALVAMSASVAGLPYLWCAPMGRAMAEPCCPEVRDVGADHDHGPSLDRPCCESQRLSSLPTTDVGVSHDVTVAPPALVAWLSLGQWLPEAAGTEEPLREAPSQVPRAGPDEPIFKLNQVYRC